LHSALDQAALAVANSPTATAVISAANNAVNTVMKPVNSFFGWVADTFQCRSEGCLSND
jgi:hypothetical protein